MGGMLCLLCLCSMDNIVWRVFCCRRGLQYSMLYWAEDNIITVKFRMLRRYRKIKEDMTLSAAKIEDDTLVSGCSASKQMLSISFYLHLPPSISL